MRIIFTSVLEEFVRLPEFVLVSIIVSIRSIRPNRCLGVTLFYYFRFLFATCENYSGESQRKLAYQDLTLARLQRQYAVTPLCHYAITPLRHYASMPLRQYAIMPVCQYASTPVRQYTSMPVRHYASCINPNKHLFKRNAVIDQGLEINFIENTTCVCKDGQLVIPKPLQVRAVKWYHPTAPWTHTS
jgi:hypothetical protein